MAEAPIAIILNMIYTVVGSAGSLIVQLLGMFFDLMDSMGAVAAVGGSVGLFLAIGVLLLVGFFVLKFIFATGKSIIFLGLAGLLLLLALTASII